MNTTTATASTASTAKHIRETVGNHVIVEIGPGAYVLYAHMDPGR